MALSSVVLAYVILQTNGGNDLHWNRSVVPYAFNDDGSRDLGAEVYPALDAGFQVWNGASGIGYSYAGCTSKGKSSVIDGAGNASTDGSSIVTWVESGWPYGAATIAITWTYFFESGEIDEADMLMNGDDYTWTTADSGGQTDVQAIAAHESGHYLGLGHTNVADATMFPTVLQGETQKRSLHADDISGARALYGTGPSGGNTFDGDCRGGGGGVGCGCSLDARGPGGGLLAGIASILALAAIGSLRLRAAPLPARRVRAGRAPAALGALAAAGLLAALAPASAGATVMLDQTIEELAADSDAVLHGDVESVETVTDGRTIQTIQRIRVREVLLGIAPGDVVEIVTPGGTLPPGVRGPNGHAGMKAAGIPEFVPGEEVVVFLRERGAGGGELTVTALQQGKLRVRRDGAGGAVVARDLDGVVRVERTEAGLVPVHEDAIAGSDLDGVLARIRAAHTR